MQRPIQADVLVGQVEIKFTTSTHFVYGYLVVARPNENGITELREIKRDKKRACDKKE